MGFYDDWKSMDDFRNNSDSISTDRLNAYKNELSSQPGYQFENSYGGGMNWGGPTNAQLGRYSYEDLLGLIRSKDSRYNQTKYTPEGDQLDWHNYTLEGVGNVQYDPRSGLIERSSEGRGGPDGNYGYREWKPGQEAQDVYPADEWLDSHLGKYIPAITVAVMTGGVAAGFGAFGAEVVTGAAADAAAADAAAAGVASAGTDAAYLAAADSAGGLMPQFGSAAGYSAAIGGSNAAATASALSLGKDALGAVKSAATLNSIFNPPKKPAPIYNIFGQPLLQQPKGNDMATQSVTPIGVSMPHPDTATKTSLMPTSIFGMDSKKALIIGVIIVGAYLAYKYDFFGKAAEVAPVA
jgi:hypothetical protein